MGKKKNMYHFELDFKDNYYKRILNRVLEILI